jgi:hypothetical protein
MSVNKLAARSLVRYIAKCEMGGFVLDPNAKSMFEFARQMSSRHLIKANPKLELDLKYFPSEKPAFLKVHFVNGHVFETQTAQFSAGELRNEVFDIAENIEYDYEASGNNPIVGDNDDDDLIVRATAKK